MTKRTKTPTSRAGSDGWDPSERKPGEVANYMLERADKEGKPITPLKLQKLVYNGYGWVRAILDRRLFDEPIEAWDHGPVIPSLYHEFKHYGWVPIKEKCVEFRPFSSEYDEPEYLPLPTDKEECDALDIVWEVYKNFTASDLRAQTHIKGTPWDKAWQSGNKIIDDAEIKRYFGAKIQHYIDKFL